MIDPEIFDAITTIVTALIGYGALRHEIRAMRADLVAMRTAKERDHEEFRERLKRLEQAA